MRSKSERAVRQSDIPTQELESIPEGSNLGLGCGNPVALAVLRKGDTVLDLGSGAGVTAFSLRTSWAMRAGSSAWI